MSKPDRLEYVHRNGDKWVYSPLPSCGTRAYQFWCRSCRHEVAIQADFDPTRINDLNKQGCPKC